MNIILVIVIILIVLAGYLGYLFLKQPDYSPGSGGPIDQGGIVLITQMSSDGNWQIVGLDQNGDNIIDVSVSIPRTARTLFLQRYPIGSHVTFTDVLFGEYQDPVNYYSASEKTGKKVNIPN